MMDYLSARSIIKNIANADESDIDWLFCEVTGVNRLELARIKQIDRLTLKKLKKYAKRLGRGMPLSVALGKAWFYDYTFAVSKHVLTPRPETEELCDLLIKQIKQNNTRASVLDLCCGSGACGITIKKQCDSLTTVTLSDISYYAIKTSKRNAKKLNADVKIVKSDMLSNITGKFDYIICNPPYIAYGDNQVETRVNKWEPHLALYADDNGYKYYKVLADNAFDYLTDCGKLYLEVGRGMANNVAKLFSPHKTEIIKDMQNVDRFVIVQNK